MRSAYCFLYLLYLKPDIKLGQLSFKCKLWHFVTNRIAMFLEKKKKYKIITM